MIVHAQQMAGWDFLDDLWSGTKSVVTAAVVKPFEYVYVKPSQFLLETGGKVVSGAVPLAQNVIGTAKDTFQTVTGVLRPGASAEELALAGQATDDGPPWGLIAGGVAVGGLLLYALTRKRKPRS